MTGGAAVAVAKPNPNPKASLNPNWAILQEQINSRRRRPAEAPTAALLGKRKDRTESKAKDPPPFVLKPTVSDCSLTDVLAMDCEMVGVSPLGNKSALGRVTLVNTWGNVVYDEYVRPMERVVDFRTKISGIRPEDMRKAKDFVAVQKKVSDLIKGRILVGHALHNDLKVLFLSHPSKDTRDTAEYQPFLREGRRKALKHLAAEILGIEIQQGTHCPVEDSRAAMLIYMKYKKEWERSIKKQLKSRKNLKNKHTRKEPQTLEADAAEL